MKKWILKALVQKGISFLPIGHQINFLFQKYITRGVRLSDTYFIDRLQHASEHLASFRQWSGKTVPITCLELGTGWYPTVPIAFFLSGSNRALSLDLVQLTNKERLFTTVSKFLSPEVQRVLPDYLPLLPDRLKILRDLYQNREKLSFSQALEQIGLAYHIGDAAKTGLPSATIDLVTSNNTLEHIYSPHLETILKELHRVTARSGGVMSHFIDMSDHFAHLDKSINIYNFLQFSPGQWRWIDNSIQPQNRLRLPNYLHIYQQLNIPITEVVKRPGFPEQLKQIKLAAPFSTMAAEDVAVSHCRIVSGL